jgi:hypothetical protein
MSEQIHVNSHVARDLLQTAAVFKTDKQVVWEYASNSLEYSQPGRPARVEVTIQPRLKKIAIADNGRGMDWSGLQNFWTLHGENQDRLAGRPGRGRFGTGKAAAFGIAGVLRVTSIKDGRKSVVELRRADVETLGNGAPIPVTTQLREAPTQEPTGTLVEIEEVHVRRLDTQGIIKYIERHLAHYPRDISVIVNSHLCEYSEPAVAFVRTFTPGDEERTVLGNATLTVKVARSALPEELRGIAVFSKGVWHETTLAGAETREMSQFLFGEIDVPAIEEDRSPISAFDNTRSLQLNRENRVVYTLMGFIGRCVEEVRRDLLAAERLRRQTEEARRLARQAEAIAQVLNDDFAQFRNLLGRVRARPTGSDDFSPPAHTGGEGSETLLPGDQLLGAPDEPDHRGGGGSGSPSGENSSGPPPGVREGDEPNRARPAGGQGKQPKPRGGFSVLFRSMGRDNDRSQYVPDERAIYINLDHPQVTAARGNGSEEDPTFRRLCYEVAFTEYSIALAYEMANRDEYLEPSEPIADIRAHLNRLARRAADFYGLSINVQH